MFKELVSIASNTTREIGAAFCEWSVLFTVVEPSLLFRMFGAGRRHSELVEISPLLAWKN
jgi:hypothetical protein